MTDDGKALDEARREFLDRRLTEYRQAIEGGNVVILVDAIRLCTVFKMPLPHWLAVAVVERLVQAFAIAPRGRRGSRPSDLAKYQQAQIHYERWSLVRELRDRKDELSDIADKGTLEEAFDAVSEQLKGTDAAGAPETVRASYKLVEGQMKRGRGALFKSSRLRSSKPGQG